MAVARSLKSALEPYEGFDNYFEYQKADFAETQEILLEGLEASSLPLKPVKAEGGYFVMVDVSECRDLIPEKYFKAEEFESDPDTTIEKNDFGSPVPLDLAFCRWLCLEKKVVTMPGTFFYDRRSEHAEHHYVRFAICRGEEITRESMRRIA